MHLVATSRAGHISARIARGMVFAAGAGTIYWHRTMGWPPGSRGPLSPKDRPIPAIGRYCECVEGFRHGIQFPYGWWSAGDESKIKLGRARTPPES